MRRKSQRKAASGRDFRAGNALISVSLTYRDELGLQKDTFVCFKINRYFVILEWAGESLVVKDMVDDLLCANYRDLKTYSVY